MELIDHGLEEMGESTGDNDEPQLLARCAFGDFGTMAAALEGLDVKLISSTVEYLPTMTTELSDEQANEVLELVGKLEGDDDVQTVFHTLA